MIYFLCGYPFMIDHSKSYAWILFTYTGSPRMIINVKNTSQHCIIITLLSVQCWVNRLSTLKYSCFFANVLNIVVEKVLNFMSIFFLNLISVLHCEMNFWRYDAWKGGDDTLYIKLSVRSLLGHKDHKNI